MVTRTVRAKANKLIVEIDLPEQDAGKTFEVFFVPVDVEDRDRKKKEIEAFARKNGVDLTGFKFNREELYDRGLS
jgi:hypothetical protein